MSGEMPLEVPLSSRRDFDLLDESPTPSGYRLPALSSILEHQLDRVSHHLASLFEIPSLCVDLRQFRDVSVDPSVASVLEHRVEAELTHAQDDTGAPRSTGWGNGRCRPS